MAHLFSPSGRVRTMFTLAPAVLAVAVSGALGVPAAGASSKQSAKAVFAVARARLIKESQLAGQWTASSYGAGSSGGGSGGTGSSINVSQCHNVNEPITIRTRTSSKVITSIGKGPTLRSRRRSTSTPIPSRPPKTSNSPPVRLSNPAHPTLFSQRKNSIAAGVGKGATVGTVTIEPVPIAKYGQTECGVPTRHPDYV